MPDTSRPLVVIAGAPTWAAEATRLLASSGYTTTRLDDPAAALDVLIDQHAALVLVDAATANWSRWVTLTKSEQATRRIPVLVVGDREAITEAAYRAGADAVLHAAALAAQLPDAIRQWARVPDKATQIALAEQCAQALPPLAQAGIAHFNAGEYYRQHDLFEELWMAESGPVRDLYRAILQVGVAYYHITQGNLRGAQRMLRRSVQWMVLLPDVCQGVDVAALRTDAARVREALDARDPADSAPFPAEMLRPIRQISDTISDANRDA